VTAPGRRLPGGFGYIAPIDPTPGSVAFREITVRKA